MSKRIVCLVMALCLMVGTVCVFAEEATSTEVADVYQIGNIVTLGSYEQDNNPDNGNEPIEWIVLDVVEEKKSSISKEVTKKALLLSAYALDAQPYNVDYTCVTWKLSTLRTWLNEDFLNAAFDEAEQAMILESKADNADDQGNNAWGEVTTSGGGKTTDRIFLLSYREVYSNPKGDDGKQKAYVYFADNDTRVCALTDYAVARGAFTSDATVDGKPAATWWLRSPGKNQFSGAGVLFDGSCISGTVDSDYLAVRPAIWVDLAKVGQ